MKKYNYFYSLLVCTAIFCGVAAAAQSDGSVQLHVQQNCVVEWGYTSDKSYTDPYTQVQIDAAIRRPDGSTLTLPGYWAGENRWRFRFSAPQTGDYTFRTSCSDADNTQLGGQTGKIVVVAYTGKNPLYAHGPIRVRPGKRVFEHQDGTPFFWLADSWWLGMCKRFTWPDGFQLLSRDRRDKGFTVIQFALSFPCDLNEFDERGANEAGFAMTEGYGTINPAYFDLTDLRVRWLIDEGLMPNVVGTWGYYLRFMGIDKMKNYWRYIIARYGAYPITWTLCGESSLVWYEDMGGEKGQRLKKQQLSDWSEVAAHIKRINPFSRLLTVHPGPFAKGYEAIEDPSTLDMIMVQPGHNGWETIPKALRELQTAREKCPDRPVMQGEVCFEGMHGGGSGPKEQRILFWTNLLSGAAGHCYGVDAIWQFNTREKPFGKSPTGSIWGNSPWEEAYQWMGSTYVGLGAKILQRYPWYDMQPHQEWLGEDKDSDNRPSLDSENIWPAYAAGVPGTFRIFYFPKRKEVTIKGFEPGVRYQAVYVDPLTGKYYPVGEVKATDGAWKSPKAPILQDWLLVLTVQ